VLIVSGATSIWWLALCAVTAINVTAWGVSAGRLGLRRARWPEDIFATRRRMLWLSAAYVLGCGFRSILPMVEVPNMCLHDVWFSRVAITRSVATIAELCFALQWGLLLREAGQAIGSRFATQVSGLLMPVIVLAQLSCWTAVLTANYLPHAIENSLWTLAATLGVAALVTLWPRADSIGRRFLATAIAGGLGYVAFMVAYDVPMYLSRWQADLAAGVETRPLIEGFTASLRRCVVSTDWPAWSADAVWLSLYFTTAVWASIALVHVPPLRNVLPESDGAR